MAYFVDAVVNGRGKSLLGAVDGRRALVLAEAALASLKSKAPVAVR